MKHYLLLALAFIGLDLAAENPVRQQMLETFIRYASIDSQSHYDSICTQGQRNMALALKSDVEDAIAKSKSAGIEVYLSDSDYLYVTIPANVGSQCPSMGVSCHLDVTPEAVGGVIHPIVDILNGHTVVRTDGTTLLGADDKCGCTIAIQLIRTILNDRSIKHGVLQFAFCPNEDVGRAADGIDPKIFSPDILFDLDGPEGNVITKSNFTARGFNVRFLGRDAHPGDAKAQKLGGATAAAAAFISYFPIETRPENSEGTQGYIHPWSFEKDGADVTVQTRVRYFDKSEGELFDRLLSGAIADVELNFPYVKVEVVYDGLQYENVAYTLHPQAQSLAENAALKIGKDIKFVDERGGTTASMFAAKGLNGGMCVFTGQHEIHSTREYADLQEMEEAYLLMLEIIKSLITLNK